MFGMSIHLVNARAFYYYETRHDLPKTNANGLRCYEDLFNCFMENVMLQYVRTILSFTLVSVTAFLVGCSGCVSKAGDRVTGTGTGTISPTGTVTGSGTGTSYSQKSGTLSGTKNNGSVNITMSNPTDKIVCTSATGVVTVFSPGQTITTSGTSTCVDTPASQVPTTTTNSSSGSGSNSSGTTTTTTTTTTTNTGSNNTSNNTSNDTSSNANSGSPSNPAHSF